MLKYTPRSVLDVGIGNGTVSAILRSRGVKVTTVDIDPSLGPDIVGSVHELNRYVDPKSFDLVLCAEVLEHLPYDLLAACARQLALAARQHVVISLPAVTGASACESTCLNWARGAYSSASCFHAAGGSLRAHIRSILGRWDTGSPGRATYAANSPEADCISNPAMLIRLILPTFCSVASRSQAAEGYAMAKVSVIIPTYNRAHAVSEAIDSVLAQTYRDFEIIVVDDASTDNTGEVLARYGDRIRVIRRETNGGAGAARNDGIRASSGEFIAFLDSDDLYLPCRLRISLEALDASPNFGGAYADLQKVAPDGTVLPSWLSVAGHQALGLIFREELVRPTLGTDTLTIRRCCFDAVGLFNESLHRFEDVHMWLRLTHRYPFLCIPEVVAVWRTHDVTPEFYAAAHEYPWRGLLKILEDVPDLTEEERRLVLMQALRAMAVHMVYLRAAGLSACARDVRLAAKAMIRQLPFGDRLLAHALIAAKQPILVPLAALARWVRRRYRRLRYGAQRLVIRFAAWGGSGLVAGGGDEF